MNTSTTNPSIQCLICGQWKRERKANGQRTMVPAEANGKEFTNESGYVADVCVGECYGELERRAA